MPQITVTGTIGPGVYNLVTSGGNSAPQTPPPRRIIDIPFGVPWQWLSEENGGYNCEDEVAFRLVIPAGQPSKKWAFAISQHNGPATQREVALSWQAFNYGPDGLILPPAYGTTAEVIYNTGGADTIYFSTRNWSPDLN